MGEFSQKAFSVLLMLTMLAACQAAPQNVPPSAPQNAPSQPTQQQQPAPTQTAQGELPELPASGNLSPTLSTTPTTQGISQEMDALIPPIPPAQLAAERTSGGILLSWTGTGSDVDTHYAIYRRSPGSEAWEMLGFVAIQGDNRGDYSYLDATAEAGQPLEYSVTTFDRYGKESDRATIQVEHQP